jgi:hypothetical protein
MDKLRAVEVFTEVAQGLSFSAADWHAFQNVP